MAAATFGVSLREEQKRQLDALAAQEGRSRSGVIGRLVEQEAARLAGKSAPVVIVDGRKFVPARHRKLEAT